MPHPKVMTIQPEFWALEWFSSTAATTPSPKRIRIAVPIVSAPMMLKRNSSPSKAEQGPRRDPGSTLIAGEDASQRTGTRESGQARCDRQGEGAAAVRNESRSGSVRLARGGGRHAPLLGARGGGARRGRRCGGGLGALLGVEPLLHARH